MNYVLVILSIAATALCWGIYGPVLHVGQGQMDGAGGKLRAFICVGIAYFLIAIVVPVLLMALSGWEVGVDKEGKEYAFTMNGTIWSLAAGAAGAIGALGIVMALSYGGKPVYVMPLVFGLAPVFNTFMSMYFSRDKELTSPNLSVFYAGLILVAAGAVTVLIFAPKADPKAHGKKPKDKDEVAEVATMTSTSNTIAANAKLQEELDKAQEDEAKPAEETEPTKS